MAYRPAPPRPPAMPPPADECGRTWVNDRVVKPTGPMVYTVQTGADVLPFGWLVRLWRRWFPTQPKPPPPPLSRPITKGT